MSCFRCRSSLSHTQEDKDENLWMAMLQPARDRHEQNVEMVLESGRLLLHTVKPVPRGNSLLVWYSDLLARAFGVPILTPAQIQGEPIFWRFVTYLSQSHGQNQCFIVKRHT